VLLINAKYDRLLEAVITLFEKFGHSFSDTLCSIIDYERPVKIARAIDTIRYDFPIPVRLALRWPITLNVRAPAKSAVA
jgi:hypothetical protein